MGDDARTVAVLALVLALFVGGIAAAIWVADAERTPGYALDSNLIYRIEIGAVLVGFAYAILVTLRLAWRAGDVHAARISALGRSISERAASASSKLRLAAADLRRAQARHRSARATARRRARASCRTARRACAARRSCSASEAAAGLPVPPTLCQVSCVNWYLP